MSNDNSPGSVSSDRFDEFKCRVLDGLEKQFQLSQKTNEAVGQHTTAIEVLKTQMGQVLDHVAEHKTAKRELRIAKLAGAFGLGGTLIMAGVEIFKHFFSKQ